jgi:acyl-CoA synthetase (AMP-forming)/AMP-acid ligase II
VALLVDQLRWMADVRPREDAYVELPSGRTLTFERWDDESDRLARALVEHGVTKSDRVLLHLESDQLARWVTSYAAIHKAGAVAVPTNVRLTGRELTAIVGHAAPVAAITSGALRSTIDQAEDDGLPLRWVLEADDDIAWVAALDHPHGRFQVAIGDGDLADIMYTSGTTGLPKGIAVRHRNTHLIPNGEPPWSGDAWIHSAPLSTFAGITFVYNPMKMGMRGLFLARFDADTWFDEVAARRPTCAFLVPATAQLLATHARWAEADLSSLTLVSIGSAPLAPTLHRAIAERLPTAVVTNNYSMTEAGTAFTYMPPGGLDSHPGSVGIPMPPTEIRIADEAGEPLPPGEVGEVLIKVGEHHREYYDDPEATARTWTGEWLRSGDLGTLDEEGYLTIVGRSKDVIIRGGNNIAATEVENALYEHAGVLEAAVVAVPHDVLGEDVGAYVVARPGVELDAEELQAFCADRLADYKRPRHIWFLDALPRNATGKVMKRDLHPPT